MVEIVLISCLSQTHIIYVTDRCYVTAVMRHTSTTMCECIMSKIKFWLAGRA